MRWIQRMVWAIVAMLVVAAGPNFSLAQQDQRALKTELPKIFDNADKNDDKRIDRTEYGDATMEAFFFIDVDKDGNITVVELMKADPQVDRKRFDASDTNKDGKLNMEEYQKALSKDFDAADKDKSGWISIEEFTVM